MFTPQRSREYDRSILKTPEHSRMQTDLALTPTSSPLHALTPVVDALRNVKDNATREFDRLYGNFLLGRSPRRSEQRKVTKRSHKMTDHTKKGDTPKRPRTRNTSLTPFMEKHSLYDNGGATNSNILSTPSLVHSAQNYDMTPNTMPRSPSDRYAPPRTRYPSSLPEAFFGKDPSIALSKKLEDESDRMEKLATTLRDIRRQTCYLANSNLTLEENCELTSNTTYHRPALSSHHTHSQTSHSEKQSLHASYPTSASEPLKPEFSVLSVNAAHPTIPSHIPPPPPPPPPPATSNGSHLVRASVKLDESKENINSHQQRTPKQVTTSTPKRAMNDVLNDIPKAKLRSTAVIRTPNGSEVVNRFWKEIHGSNNKKRSNESLVASTPETDSNILTRKSTWAMDDGFWEAPATRSSRFNDKLRRAVEAEKKEQEQQHRYKEQQSRTLEDEMQLANQKSLQSALEDRRRNLANRSFSLRPIQTDECSSDSAMSSPSSNRPRRIDGDEWMFGGREYLVDESPET
ncbi:hypothetical protein EC973_000159 [Apophysomyces ossiformis]|uniref:Uncharacterized protein n=1 Tax=Apophysomyces ossiformis TaxID=679940 RepID=A0A8H7BU36_9FUNG|nr:hypothetical protein EC973_000159 [Apophysomyces ossiformis]